MSKFRQLLDQKCTVYKSAIACGDEVYPCELKKCSVLHIATVNMHLELIKQLVNFGANTLTTDSMGSSPIEIAMKQIMQIKDSECKQVLHEIGKALLSPIKVNTENDQNKNQLVVEMDIIAEQYNDLQYSIDTVKKH